MSRPATARSRMTGSIINPEKAPAFNPSVPDQNLTISGVFGYAGQCRGNLSYNKNGEVVYFSAAVGIM